jgi:hypothetical protein
MRSVSRVIRVGSCAAVLIAAGAADAQTRGRESPASIRPPGPPPTNVRAGFIAADVVALAWTAASGAQSYTVVRGFAGMSNRQTFSANGTSYADKVGMLPPNLRINYEVIANFADKSPATASLSIKTPDTQPAANVGARLEDNGRKVVVTWTNAANLPYPVDHLYLAAVGGSTHSQVIPVGATTLTLTGLKPGQHTYAIVGYYSLPGVGVVEGNAETAPRFTVRVPHCVLLYKRARRATDLGPRGDTAEVLLLAAGESRTFITDWDKGFRDGTDSERYGAHLRTAANGGTNLIELTLHSIVAPPSISFLRRGELNTYLDDLARVTCRP